MAYCAMQNGVYKQSAAYSSLLSVPKVKLDLLAV